MPSYLIETSHDPTPEECVRVLNTFAQAGSHYLLNANWGCNDGVHKSWLIVEAENDTDARLMVPPIFRADALVVKLNKVTPEELKLMHEHLK